MRILWISLCIVLIYCLYLLSRLRIFFFFYTHPSLLTTMNSFLSGQALDREEYYSLYCIPQAFLFAQIEKHFLNIHWNPASIQFLHYSGFIPYYLQQQKADPFLISCLCDVTPDFCNELIRTIYPKLPLKTQRIYYLRSSKRIKPLLWNCFIYSSEIILYQLL